MLVLLSAVPSARYAVPLLVLVMLDDLPSSITDFLKGDLVTFSDAAERQAWMSPTDSILPHVGPVVPPHQPVLPGMHCYNARSISTSLTIFFKDATY